MKSEFPGAVPEIPVTDIASAAAYYQNLGFSLDWGGEELGLAGISKGNCRMFLADQEYRKEYGNVGPTLIWLNLESKGGGRPALSSVECQQRQIDSRT